MQLSEHAQRQLRINLERWASRMAREVIAPRASERLSFAVIAYDHSSGNLALSSAGRFDVSKAMRILLAELDSQ